MTESQFWWNWWINAAVALGTFLVVLAALFGEYLRLKMFPPRLKIKLLNPEGETATTQLITHTEGKIIGERREDIRYYHIQVFNENRLSSAKDVQVFLTAMEKPGPDGELKTVWRGDVPLRWRHQEIYPLTRTVGPPADCDLCSVIKDKWLELHPLIEPLNLEKKWREQTLFIVSLQARANEVDSPALRVQVAWDGTWKDGDKEMKNHLVVKVIDFSKPF